jgi:hypothetical protein
MAAFYNIPTTIFIAIEPDTDYWKVLPEVYEDL